MKWYNAEDFDGDELEAVMSEGPDNHGHKASGRMPSSTDGHDGQTWPSARSTLDVTQQARHQFVLTGGVQVYGRDDVRYTGGVTDLSPSDIHRTLTRAEIASLDKDSLRLATLERLGFSDHDLRTLSRPGRRGPEAQELSGRFDAAVLAVVEAGSRATDLARALGFPVERSGHSLRMGKCLTRARRVRQQREESNDTDPPDSP